MGKDLLKDLLKFLIGGDSDSDKLMRWVLGLFLGSLAAGAVFAMFFAS